MKEKLNGNRIQVWFYACWVILGLLQAFFTDLTGDEAYYWKYAQHPAWGYFDHPPVTAFAIRLGYWIFPNELGVRLIPLLMVTGGLYCLERLIQPKQTILFYGLAAAVGILHFIGFMALPDAPLLFFTALFLLLYKKYLAAPSSGLALGIGLVAGMMILSKYHALLIIGLLILSRIRLLKDIRFWMAVLVCGLVLVPHLQWQIAHGFPSISYHLFERSVKAYTFSNTYQYILAQPFVLGPFTGILFLIAAYKVKAETTFGRSMKFLFWGGYLFFFLMTFKGRVEAHWTLFCLLPGMYFGCQFLENSRRTQKTMSFLIPISLVLILIARIPLAVNILPKDRMGSGISALLLDQQQWADDFEKVAGEAPVLFMNSYAEASLYEFYTGHPAASLNNISGRKNQFDIWGYEEQFIGKRVMVVINYPHPDAPLIPGLNPRERQYKFMDDFQTYAGLKLVARELEAEGQVREAMHVVLEVESSPIPAHWKDLDQLFSCMTYQIFSGNQMVADWPTPIQFRHDLLTEQIEFYILAPSKPGKYGLHFSIQTEWLPPGIHSPRYEIVILPYNNEL